MRTSCPCSVSTPAPSRSTPRVRRLRSAAGVRLRDPRLRPRARPGRCRNRDGAARPRRRALRASSPSRPPPTCLASGLVLSGVPLFDADERAAFLANWTPEAPIDGAGSQFGWALERYLRTWGPDLPPAMLHLAVVELMRVASRYEWGYQAAFRYDPSDALAAVDVPVLLLAAEFDILAPRTRSPWSWRATPASSSCRPARAAAPARPGRVRDRPAGVRPRDRES